MYSLCSVLLNGIIFFYLAILALHVAIYMDIKFCYQQALLSFWHLLLYFVTMEKHMWQKYFIDGVQAVSPVEIGAVLMGTKI